MSASGSILSATPRKSSCFLRSEPIEAMALTTSPRSRYSSARFLHQARCSSLVMDVLQVHLPLWRGCLTQPNTRNEIDHSVVPMGGEGVRAERRRFRGNFRGSYWLPLPG